MTEDAVRDLVDRRTRRTSRREWCRINNVSTSHLSEFMNGLRPPTTDLLNALNLEYRIVRKCKSQP